MFEMSVVVFILQNKSSSRFDGPIHPMADLEMFFPMNFF